MVDVAAKEDLLITCKSGVTIRMNVTAISEQGRATQGVKLIRIDEGDEIAALSKMEVDDEAEVLGIIEGEALDSEENTEIAKENNNPETTISPENTSEGEQEAPIA
jgi:DNA gyrase subunit A